MAVIGVSKRIKVYRKTKYRCAICGREESITCDHFIPKWVRIVGNDEPNLIPLCEECNYEKGCSFIPTKKLKYLKKEEVDRLITYYASVRQYLKKYVVEYGSQRTQGSLDVEQSLLILKQYDEYIETHNLEV